VSEDGGLVEVCMARATVFFRSILGEFVDSDVILEEFSRHFSRRVFESEAFFVREAEANERIGFLEEGYMRSFVLTGDGDEANVRIAQPPELVSGGSAFQAPSPVSVQAIARSVVYCADWRTISQLARRHNEIKVLLNRYLSRGSLATARIVARLLRLDARERYLLFLKEFPGAIERIHHYHIAGYLGITPVQLSRIRRKDGAINKGK